ncbi:MFS transporter [Pigmentiphaga litoralis]|uniref:MFS transporter n=1 Tax=Pigmentiphaga litoralis TaxID=516702 RepID=UPI003B429CDD
MGFRESLLPMLGIASVNLLIALDQTVISTALPSIAQELDGFDWYAWVAAAYLLGSVVAVPVFGRLGDFFGRKPFIVASIALFTGASLLCAASPTVIALSAARLLQGIAGGMMVGTAYAAMADLFPDPKARLRWQMVLAVSYGVATAAGPTLGGLISEQVGWRATFLVNVPVGIFGLVCTVRHMPRVAGTLTHLHGARALLDWPGAAWIVVVLCVLQVALHRLPEHGLDAGTLSLLVIALAGAAVLIATERRAQHPMLPLDLFTTHEHLVFFLLSFICGAALFSLIFFVPLLLQQGLAMPPQQAGTAMTPMPVCLALGSILNSAIVVKLKRPGVMLGVGFVLLLTCFVGLNQVDAGTSGWRLGMPLAGAGLGLGLLLNNLNVFGQQIVGKARYGIFTALMQSTRMAGGMIGTAALGAWVATAADSPLGLVDALLHGFNVLGVLVAVALLLLRALPPISLSRQP